MDLNNRSDISYTPTQRGILLFEAAREALHQSKRRWRTLPPPPGPIRVSREVAQSLAPASTTHHSEHREENP